MTDYQLKKDVADSFEFEIGENKYEMRYMNGKDRKGLAELSAEINKLERRANNTTDESEIETIQKEAEPLGKKMSELLHSLITAKDEKTEDIRDVLERETAPVIRNFQEMVRIEQSLEATPNTKPNFSR